MVPSHPHVEPVMQKEVGQEGTDNPALWRPPFSDDETPIRHLHGRPQPSLNVEEPPHAGRMSTHRAHEQIGVDTVEKALDVEIKNPAIAPASLPRRANRIERQFAGPVPIRVLVEVRLRQWLQIPFDHHLSDPVGDRGNPQRPCPSVAFWYVNSSHRRRKVAPR
jgi:hypothetical protein